jgi:alanine dehydrogenase
MIIGVPRETFREEHRVGLIPFAVARLVRHGHTVLVEKNAGETARFADVDYEEAGARIVYESEEIYQRANLVCRVGLMSTEELGMLKPGSVVCAFHHLAVAPRENLDRLMELEATLVGYEIIQDRLGELPILLPMSEMAGQMAVHIAAHYLQIETGGRGVLLGNVPGVPPPTVVILGAGTVGRASARQARASGAHVIVLDADVRKLTALSHELSGQVVTATASIKRLAQFSAIADVLIGAILIPGERAPFLVTEAMVRGMKKGSVVIDVSIDQGGCVETSRPTTLSHPTYKVHDVVHYCVPNMTANIARTASRALVNATLPYLMDLAGKGLERALSEDDGLAAGLYLYRGKLVNENVAAAFGMKAELLATVLEDEEGRS